MIQLAVPSFLFSLLLLAVLLGYLLRRWERRVLAVIGGILGATGVWLWRLPTDVQLLSVPFLPVVLDRSSGIWEYGFRFQLMTSNEPIVVGVLLMLGAGLMLAAAASQGILFPSSILLFGSGCVGIALMVDAPLSPIVLAPISLSILMTISVFTIQGGERGYPLGSLRVLLPPILATPFVLLAAWNLEQAPLNPQDTRLVANAAQLMGVGMIFLLAPAPLHSMQPQLGETSPPIATAVTMLLYQILVLYVVFLATTSFPALRESSAIQLWLTTLGTLTLIWGGVAAAGASHPGRLWGYAMLHDWGLILLLLGGFNEVSRPLVISLFALRILSTLSAATGLAQIRQAAGALDLESLHGVGNRLPWSTTAFLLGSMGLAGFPLTAGFSGHWSALQVLAENDWRFAAVVLLSSGGVIFGFVRLVGIFFGRLHNPHLPRERPLGVAFAVFAILLVSSIAIAPQLFELSIAQTLLALE